MYIVCTFNHDMSGLADVDWLPQLFSFGIFCSMADLSFTTTNKKDDCPTSVKDPIFSRQTVS